MSKITLERPWKATLQAYPKKSLLSLYSLWDVLYTSEGDLLIDSASSIAGGFKLEHDIICYSQDEYSSFPNIKTSGQTIFGNITYTAEELYELLGIDVSIARYDPRAKTKIVTNSHSVVPTSVTSGKALPYLIQPSPSSIPIFKNGQFELHDKDSVLLPKNMEDFVTHGVYYDDNSSSGIQGDYLAISAPRYTAPFTLPYPASFSDLDNKSPIFLIKEDNGFKGTLATSVKLSAYNRIVLNPRNKWTAALVAKALLPNFERNTNSSSGLFKAAGEIAWNDKDSSIRVSGDGESYNPEDTSFYDFIFKKLPGLVDDNNPDKEITKIEKVDGNWASLLKSTYIWIKAPFFGDYIQPDVFNQNLDSGADVIHKNLILSKSADYNKYDVATDSEAVDELRNTASLPYVPSVSPTLDLLSPKILKNTIGNEKLNVSQAKMEALINAGDDPNTEIGSIAIAPEVRDNGPVIRLPNYFDPETKEDETAYARNKLNSGEFHIPTIIPKSGNLYIDGRVISPTTDEIWTYLKQLTEGRIPDSKVYKEASEKDIALPVGTNKIENRVNNNDTRLLSVPDSEFKFRCDQGEVYGDVLKAEGKLDSSLKNYEIQVSSFINNNDGIKYVLYDSFKTISKSVTKFDQTESGDIKTRDVANFTAWAKLNNTKDVVKDGDVIVDNDTLWAPRKYPLSLRELEAAILGVKYNTIALARFTKENFTVSGPLGYEDKNEEGVTLAAGSLYQMHRDYNYKVDNPNTFFKKNGEGFNLYSELNIKNDKAGMDATFSDLEGNNSENDIREYATGEPKKSKMPLLVENYGKSKYLGIDSGDYMGTDVYMAADGTWRYKNEHTRIPILRSEY